VIGSYHCSLLAVWVDTHIVLGLQPMLQNDHTCLFDGGNLMLAVGVLTLI